jgi:hypothetical protein
MSVGTKSNAYKERRGAQGVYVRRAKTPGGDRYYQLVRSYREGGTVKKKVLVHLGPYSDTLEALKRWRADCQELDRLGKHTHADKLRAKCSLLAELTGADTNDPYHYWYKMHSW